jgi:acyl carrier protein
VSIEDRLTAVFRDVFGDPGLTLTSSSTAADFDGWDSLQHVTLMYLVEEEFDVEFVGDEAADLADVGALTNLLRAKGCN